LEIPVNNTSVPAPALPTTETAAAVPSVPPAPPAPSIHVRAVITWLAIFPLVAVGMLLSAPLTEGWHPVLRALALTLVVVPAAVYVVLPRLFGAYGGILRRAAAKSSR
jgi:antibiotic biosynthesis monooxygenase (ABM) superfamily enzyme